MSADRRAPTLSAPPSAQPRERSGAARRVGPVAWRAVLPIAAVVAAVHMVAATVPRRWLDEELQLAIGRYHLDWGSVDQPPVTPLLARLADTLAPDAGWALSVPAVLATAAAVVLVALTARELGGDGRAQSIAALAQATGVLAAVYGHWLTPYALEPAQWAAIFWLLARWVRLRDDRLLIVAGVVVGLAAETKFQVVALGVAVLIAVALVGPRDLLRRRALWIGVAAAAAIAAPTLVWQAANGWPQLAMTSVVSVEGEGFSGGRGGLAWQMLFAAGPLGVVLVVHGLVVLARDPRWRSYRFLGVAFVLLYAAFLITDGRMYYLGPAYGAIIAVSAAHLSRRRLVTAAVAVGAAVSVALCTVVLLPFSAGIAGPGFARVEVATVTRAYQDLPATDRPRTVLMGSLYPYAAFLDGAPRTTGLPPVASPNRAYGWFPPPAETATQALYVGDPTALRPWFATVVPVARVDAPDLYGGDGISVTAPGPTVWLLSGRTAPWDVIWPHVRSLTLVRGSG